MNPKGATLPALRQKRRSATSCRAATATHRDAILQAFDLLKPIRGGPGRFGL
jgi:hypothetical protein